MVEVRVHERAGSFAVAIRDCAVMSNHLRVVALAAGGVTKDGVRKLIVRDGQHEYVFEEAK